MNDVFSTRPEKPKALEPFADIQPQIEQMKSLRVDSLKNFTSEGFAGAPSNRWVHYLMLGISYFGDADIAVEL